MMMHSGSSGGSSSGGAFSLLWACAALYAVGCAVAWASLAPGDHFDAGDLPSRTHTGRQPSPATKTTTTSTDSAAAGLKFITRIPQHSEPQVWVDPGLGGLLRAAWATVSFSTASFACRACLAAAMWLLAKAVFGQQQQQKSRRRRTATSRLNEQLDHHDQQQVHEHYQDADRRHGRHDHDDEHDHDHDGDDGDDGDVLVTMAAVVASRRRKLALIATLLKYALGCALFVWLASWLGLLFFGSLPDKIRRVMMPPHEDLPPWWLGAYFYDPMWGPHWDWSHPVAAYNNYDGVEVYKHARAGGRPTPAVLAVVRVLVDWLVLQPLALAPLALASSALSVGLLGRLTGDGGDNVASSLSAARSSAWSWIRRWCSGHLPTIVILTLLRSPQWAQGRAAFGALVAMDALLTAAVLAWTPGDDLMTSDGGVGLGGWGRRRLQPPLGTTTAAAASAGGERNTAAGVLLLLALPRALGFLFADVAARLTYLVLDRNFELAASGAAAALLFVRVLVLMLGRPVWALLVKQAHFARVLIRDVHLLSLANFSRQHGGRILVTACSVLIVWFSVLHIQSQYLAPAAYRWNVAENGSIPTIRTVAKPENPALELAIHVELADAPRFALYDSAADAVLFSSCPYDRVVRYGHYEGWMGWQQERNTSAGPPLSVDSTLVRVFCIAPFLGWKEVAVARFVPRPDGLQTGPPAPIKNPGDTLLRAEACEVGRGRIDFFSNHDYSTTDMSRNAFYLAMDCDARAKDLLRRRQHLSCPTPPSSVPSSVKLTSDSAGAGGSIRKSRPNVLVLMPDSMSAAEFFEFLPQTVELLRQLNEASSTHEVFHFPYHTTVDRKSHGNQDGLLTGYFWTRNPGFQNASHPAWLWRDFARGGGYRTAFADGECQDWIAQSVRGLKSGTPFPDIGLDHYFNGLRCHPWREGDLYPRNLRWLQGGRLLFDVLLEYAEQYFRVPAATPQGPESAGARSAGRTGARFYAADQPRFMFLSILEAHTPDGNSIRLADTKLAAFLRNLLARDPNLMVALWSDHGPTYGTLPRTLRQVHLHDFPPLFLIAPKQWLDEDSADGRRRRKALLANQNRSVTSFDLNASFRHLAFGSEKAAEQERGDRWGESLFARELPQRTCLEAHSIRYCDRAWEPSQRQQCMNGHDADEGSVEALRWPYPYQLGALANRRHVPWPKDHF